MGTSPGVQWLRRRTPSAGGPGSIPGQETRSHMLQLRPRATKKINKHKYINIKRRKKIYQLQLITVKNYNQPYSTGNYIQCPKINHNGKE